MTDSIARATAAARVSGSRYFALLPAGGTGSRLGAALPKQYLLLAGRTILDWAVTPFLAADWITATWVVVTANDAYVDAALAPHDVARQQRRLVVATVGGPTRRDSVLNGLAQLRAEYSPADDDWVLVHDAARPGLDSPTLQRLRDALADDPVGGLLALPVVDTVKRADHQGKIVNTVAREQLWLAQTPQMFRFGLLIEALQRFADVTDEAAAMEATGYRPQLVRGSHDNFKVTAADDLHRMAQQLAERSPADPLTKSPAADGDVE